MTEVGLSIASMGCRRCVREVTGWLRDVPGVETLTADCSTGLVVVRGTMCIEDVMGVFAGSTYDPRLVDAPAADAPPVARSQSPASSRRS